ncbi:MAG: prephenate dehydratase [Lentisphaerae bacterium]|mgnify:CR=1 FL=1|nr:prephenate dehydratase [Victivallaceae bacterium]NLK82825.1 prephenate dehydratase [Lentisphaerota bacterium]
MELKQLRDKIDQIDQQIVKLLNERYHCAKAIGSVKQQQNQPVYVPEREKRVLDMVCSLNQECGGIVKPETLRAVYREIMSGAISLESPIKVSFLGPRGTFSHEAAIQRFGRSVEFVEALSIGAAFLDVETGRADYACVPVENSTEGAVSYTLDTLVHSRSEICAEMNVAVHHNLLARCPKEKITKIYSHEQIFGQCRNYLAANFPKAEQVIVSSSARAAKLAAEEPNTGVVAGLVAAEVFQLHVLERNIEDFAHNTTRFFVISRQKTEPTGDDKTSVCFSVNDRVGALHDVLKPFKAGNIMMTMIESRPMKTNNWEYCFFVDVLGHQHDPSIQKCFAEVSENCRMFKILGSYPRSPSE